MKFSNAVLATALVVSAAGSAFAQAAAFSDKDKTFLKDSAVDNLAEVNFAKQALEKSKNPAIRSFAEMMIKDHLALIEGAAPIVKKAAVDLPDGPGAMKDAIYLKEKVLSGDTYDKSYVKMMVEDHATDIKKVTEEHDSTTNADMKAMTEHALKVMSGHKVKIDAMAAKMGIKVDK